MPFTGEVEWLLPRECCMNLNAVAEAVCQQLARGFRTRSAAWPARSERGLALLIGFGAPRC